jgi:hypothetical protein
MFFRSSVSLLYISRSFALFSTSTSQGKGAVSMRHAGDKKKMQKFFYTICNSNFRNLMREASEYRKFLWKTEKIYATACSAQGNNGKRTMAKARGDGE